VESNRRRARAALGRAAPRQTPRRRPFSRECERPHQPSLAGRQSGV